MIIRPGMDEKPAPTPYEEFITPKEGAAILGVSAWRMRRALHGNNPPPYKKRFGRYLFPKKAFLIWASQDVID